MMMRILLVLGLLTAAGTGATAWFLNGLRAASVSIDTPLAEQFDVASVTLDEEPFDQPLDAWLTRVRAHAGLDADGQRFTVRATHYDHGQAPLPNTPTLLARTVVDVHTSRDGRTADLQIRNQARYPYPFNLEWSESLPESGIGRIEGADTFGGPTSRAMEPARRAVRARELELASISALMSTLDALGPLRSGTLGTTPILAFTARWHDSDLTVITDASTARPLRVSWLEDRPIDGDVQITVDWSSWDQTQPTRRTWAQEGRVIRVEQILDRQSAPAPSPATAKGGRGPDYLYGLERSQFLTTWQGYGFPQEERPDEHIREWKEAAPGVHLILGEFHNSMVVEMSDAEIVVVEAPFSPERTVGLLDEIATRWPSHTITHVIQTHWHEDHSGGLRTFIARGIQVIAPSTTSSLITEWAETPKTVRPDPLSTSDRVAKVISVSDSHTLSGSTNTLDIRAMPDNPHAPGMLVVRVAGPKVLFTADLFNPGLFPTAGMTRSMQLAVIDFIDHRSLAKAGVYASSLSTFLDRNSIEVNRIVGGHGPEIADFDELAFMASYADQDNFTRQLKSFHGG